MRTIIGPVGIKWSSPKYTLKPLKLPGKNVPKKKKKEEEVKQALDENHNWARWDKLIKPKIYNINMLDAKLITM